MLYLLPLAIASSSMKRKGPRGSSTEIRRTAFVGAWKRAQGALLRKPGQIVRRINGPSMSATSLDRSLSSYLELQWRTLSGFSATDAGAPRTKKRIQLRKPAIDKEEGDASKAGSMDGRFTVGSACGRSSR